MVKTVPEMSTSKKFQKGLKDYDKLCVIFGFPEVQSIREDERNKDQLSDGSSEGVAYRARKGCKSSPKSIGMDLTGEKSFKRQKLEKNMSSTTASLDSVGDVGDGCGNQSGQVQDVLRCMEALNVLEGIDGPSYVKATKYIHDDPLRKMFLCMPDERKKDWVLNI
uniref:Uncharacterized protein n=1 Tax=Opuntia streptacantha TaxID=393608 RepID=A0A7C9D1D6_OPUST